MKRRVCVIFDDPGHAVRANEALIGSLDIQTPLQQSIVRPPIGRSRPTWRDVRALTGMAAIAAALGLLLGLAVFAITTAAGLPGSLLVAALTGLGTGAVCGLALGMLTGATEPTPSLRRLDDRLAPGQAALSAAFIDGRSARRARQLLLDCPGAVAAI